MILTLAVSQLDTREHIHTAICDLLMLPSSYGNNFDALHDVLTSLTDPTTILVDFEGKTLPELPKVTLTFLRVLYDSARENPRLQADHDRRSRQEENAPEGLL